MSKEVVVDDAVEPVEGEANPVEDVKQTQKVFTQAEVDSIVKQRVSREQVQTKEARLSLETMQKESEEKIQAYESVISKMIANQLEPLPDGIKSLVKKLSLLDQIDWLSSADNLIEKREIPETPKGSTSNKPKVSDPGRLF